MGQLGAQVGPSVTFLANGTLVNGDRFLAVTPFILPIGMYSVVAVGFGRDLNGNVNVSPITTTENDGGGLITFVGTGRYDLNTTLDFPLIIQPSVPSDPFLAGTFQFAPVTALTLTKAFSAPFISVGNTAVLTLTVANANAVALAGVTFSDTLPPGLVIAPNGLISNTCGVTLVALDGTNLISLTGGTVAANATCTITVRVLATAPGALTNTTSTITATNAPPGIVATAPIIVIPADVFQVRYAANLPLGDSVIDITNNGASSTNPNPLLRADGNICVNAYVFSPDEQLISCCTCLVTPNGLASLSARLDLINNTLTPGVPTSIVIKLLASSQPTCNASTVTVASLVLGGGLTAFGTTIHATPPAGTLGLTETRFARATLSAAELTRITTLCGFIQITGSGFGICRSCRLGGLGAGKQE